MINRSRPGKHQKRLTTLEPDEGRPARRGWLLGTPSRPATIRGMTRRQARVSIRLSGLATAHSHAFQRALRGRTHRVGLGRSFWSWRDRMYDLANRLDPETMYAISRFAFAELARAGFTAVGEFHYLHHQPGGHPYNDRTVLAKAVVRAARDVGLRITLLRVLYERGGFHQDLTPAQQRFTDRDLDTALSDVEELRTGFSDDPCVRVGLAPHSLRAVPADWLRGASQFAEKHNLVLHMHVAEQPREVERVSCGVRNDPGPDAQRARMPEPPLFCGSRHPSGGG